MASKNNKKFEAEITYFIAKTNTKMGQVKMLAIFRGWLSKKRPN
jgi:hypothetical protein